MATFINFIKITVIFIYFIFATTVIAFDKPDHMTITSDSALINYKERLYTFTGNVHIKDNKETKIDGDEVIAKQNEQHKFTYLYDFGNPAFYHTIIDPQKPPLDSNAQIIKFFPLRHQAILINQAFAKQGANTITGPILYYDTLNRILLSQATKLGRTHITVDSEGKVNIEE